MSELFTIMSELFTVYLYFLMWVIFLGLSCCLCVNLRSCVPLWILLIPSLIQFDYHGDDCKKKHEIEKQLIKE